MWDESERSAPRRSALKPDWQLGIEPFSFDLPNRPEILKCSKCIVQGDHDILPACSHYRGPVFSLPFCFITRSPLIISFRPLLRWPYKSWHTHAEIEKILDLHTSAIAEPFWYANRTKKSCYLGLYIWTAEAKNKKKITIPSPCCHCQLTIRRRPEYSTYLSHLSTYTTPLNVVYPPQRERESKWQTALSCLLSCRRWLFLAATSRIILGEPFAKCFGCYRDPVYFVGKTLNISPWHPSLCTVVGDGRVWHSSPVVCWMQLRVFHFAGSSIIWICPSTVIIGVVVGSREGRQAGRQSWTAVYSRLHGFVDPLPRGDTAHVRPVVFTLVEMAQRLQRCCLVSIPPGMSPPDFQSRGGGLLWLL